MFETKTPSEIASILDTNLNLGLDEETAIKRLKENGKNVLKEKKKKSFFLIYISQFNDPMMIVLMIAASISLLLKEYIDTTIIAIVTLFNSFIGAIQENKAERALESLKKLSKPTTIVKRNGKLKEINSSDLVVGDLVSLEEGQIIPADLRITKSFELRVDESSLTGESEPVKKTEELILPTSNIGDLKNMAFMSTYIIKGRGEGVVVKTGMKSEIGKIAKMIDQKNSTMTPLQKKLAGLSKFIGIATVVICLLIFLFSLLHGNDFSEMLITSISLAVAAIPEGLPAAVTIVLSLGVMKMVKVNTIVRKLHSVETLGAVSVVCSDKTGTITENKMRVTKFTNFQKVLVSPSQLLLRCSMYCNNATDTLGDRTEIALLDFAKKYSSSELLNVERLFENPFSSDRKMMSVVIKENDQHLEYSKGAPDVILKKCDRYLEDGHVFSLNNDIVKGINNLIDELSSQALRVLALAYKKSDLIDENNLIFIGLVGIIDPPREETYQAVKDFQKAGIKTVMITGDHQKTAFAIAKQVGIATSINQCITGEELNKLNDNELAKKINDKVVFARVNPEHKMQIVRSLKKTQIVAMTGDGVNDAPSLKEADIGIAMGISGTDVAKSAADMVISDDNFATIKKAIAEGRGVFLNIKKTVLFLLSSNFGEVLVMFVALILGLPSPLLAVHILWINLISDGLPALALGADPKDEFVMDSKPRLKGESLFARGGFKLLFMYSFFIFLITLISFLLIPVSRVLYLNPGLKFYDLSSVYEEVRIILTDPDVLFKSRTFAFTTLGMSQLFHMVGMSGLKNSFIHVFKKKNIVMLIAFIFGLVLQVAITEIDFLISFFKTTPLDYIEWTWLIIISMFPLIIHELLVPYYRVHDL